MYQKIILKSGLRVLIMPRSETSVFTALSVFGVGSRQEEDKVAGISHFLEHMAYKGTKKRKTPKEVAEFVDSLGGEHNAFTSKEYTGFYVKASSDHLMDALDFLSDNISNSIYPIDELNREKAVILEEIKMYEDIPQYKVGEMFEILAFGDNAIGRPIVGRSKTVQQLSRDDIVTFHRDHYRYNNAVLAIAGNFKKFDQRGIIDQIESSFKLNPHREISNRGFVSPANYLPAILNKKTEQSSIVIGFLGPSLLSVDWHVATVLAKVLGGSMSSRMFSEIRERLGLAYSISTDFRSFSDVGVFSTQAGVSNTSVEKATVAILDQYQKIILEKVSNSELERAKEMLRGGLLIDMEDSEEVANSYALDELLLNRIETDEETIKKYQKVTAEEIQLCAKKYFDFKKIIFAGVGPNIEQGNISKLLK